MEVGERRQASGVGSWKKVEKRARARIFWWVDQLRWSRTAVTLLMSATKQVYCFRRMELNGVGVLVLPAVALLGGAQILAGTVCSWWP